jgi:hypothetical protein
VCKCCSQAGTGNLHLFQICEVTVSFCIRYVVGIYTDYWLGGPVIKSGGGKIFHTC